MLYFRPEDPDNHPTLGNLYYREYDTQGQDWGGAVKVSSQSFNHLDPIFRAEFATDGEGRIHVVWFQGGSSGYLYTRSNPERKVFEEQRSIVSQYSEGIDAGSTIAANGEKVIIVWASGDLNREDQRTVYSRQSNDFGKTFGEEVEIGDASLGACGCCGLAVKFDKSGQLIVAYRSATNGTGRNMQVFNVNPDSTESASSRYYPLHELRNWELPSCPVTTNDLVKDEQGNVWLIYENSNRIVRENLSTNASPRLVSGEIPEARQKHPAMAFNEQGYQLVAWGEGRGFFSGGTLHWILLDRNGKQVAQSDLDTPSIADRSFAAAVKKPDGGFMILY